MDDNAGINHTNEMNGESELSPEELNEISQIRRNKLEELKNTGKNPFEITKYDVTHFSKDIINNYTEPE